jgi:hypothetical protein
VERLGDVVGLARVVLGGVRDAEAAAEVDLGELDAVLVAYVGEELHDAARGHLESGHVEDLRADVRVNPDEFQTVEAEGTPYGFGGLAAREGDAELLVLVGGGDEFVGVRLDADGHPDLDALALALALGDVGDPDDLLERVQDDPADADAHGALDLFRALVVAVEGDALGGHPGVEGGGQLPAGTHVEIQSFFMDPLDDGAGEEGLARVEDVGVLAEGVGPGAAAGAEVGLVEEEGGGAELLGEPRHFDPADGDDAVLAPGDRTGPDLLVEGVEVGGRGGVVALVQVGVAGAGGVCGTAHGRVLCLSRTLRGIRVR